MEESNFSRSCFFVPTPFFDNFVFPFAESINISTPKVEAKQTTSSEKKGSLGNESLTIKGTFNACLFFMSL